MCGFTWKIMVYSNYTMDSYSQISATLQPKGELRSQWDPAVPAVWYLRLLCAQRRDLLRPSDTHQPFLRWITLLLRSLLQHRVGSDFNIGSGCLLLYCRWTDRLGNGHQMRRRRNLSPVLNHKELNFSNAAFTYYNWCSCSGEQIFSSPPPVRKFCHNVFSHKQIVIMSESKQSKLNTDKRISAA